MAITSAVWSTSGLSTMANSFPALHVTLVVNCKYGLTPPPPKKKVPQWFTAVSDVLKNILKVYQSFDSKKGPIFKPPGP